MRERNDRLVLLQDRITHEGMQAQVGRTVEVLVHEGRGREGRLSARLRERTLLA